jgi:hypothetical protein
MITVLLERLEKQRLPRLLSIQKRVDNGEVLSDFDLNFLKEVHVDTSKIKPLLDEKPEYHSLVTKLIGLYKYIVDKALENEKKVK